MKIYRLLLVLVVIAFGAAACKTSPDEGVRVAPEIGAIAPEFSLTNTAGEDISLSEHRGQVVLINFWATWCPPCLQEMPGIDARHEQHQGDLVVMAVNNDESEAQVTAYKDELSLSFEPLLDPGGKTVMLYQVRAFPTSVFVNQHGIIQFVHIGLMTESQLDDYLAQLGLGAETASN